MSYVCESVWYRQIEESEKEREKKSCSRWVSKRENDSSPEQVSSEPSYENESNEVFILTRGLSRWQGNPVGTFSSRSSHVTTRRRKRSTRHFFYDSKRFINV